LRFSAARQLFRMAGCCATHRCEAVPSQARCWRSHPYTDKLSGGSSRIVDRFPEQTAFAIAASLRAAECHDRMSKFAKSFGPKSAARQPTRMRALSSRPLGKTPRLLPPRGLSGRKSFALHTPRIAPRSMVAAISMRAPGHPMAAVGHCERVDTTYRRGAMPMILQGKIVFSAESHKNLAHHYPGASVYGLGVSSRATEWGAPDSPDPTRARHLL
jgi:hypothetical protein